jgi:hypothetical protein
MVKGHNYFVQGPITQLQSPYLKGIKFRREVSFTYSKKALPNKLSTFLNWTK